MGEDIRMGAESCRWISMQTVTPMYVVPKVCNLTNHGKSKKHQ